MVHSPKPTSFPLAPGALPVLGHLPRIHLDVLGLLRSSAASVGPVFRIDHGFGNHLTYLYGDDGFSLLRNDRVDSSAIFELVRNLVADSMLPVDGAVHRRMRGAMDQPFSPRGLQTSNVGAIVHDVVSEQLASWRGKTSITISAETREIALAVIFRTMGIEPLAIPTWRSKYHEFSLGILDFPLELPGTPRWRARRAMQWIDSQFTRLINERRRAEDHHSFLGSLVHGEDEDGHHISNAELVGNLRLLAFAGHDTTASVMTWMMVHLAADISHWIRLRDEALGTDGPLSPSELAQFPFAEAFFRETTRLYAPAWFVMRKVRQAFDFGGTTIPAGQSIVLPLISWSRSPTRYRDPDRFDPNRWVGHEHARHPIETCSFGGGPHFCLGYRLALLEGVHFIVAVARELGRRRLRPVLRGPVPPPRYLPFTRAPMRTRIMFEPSP